MTGKKDDQAKKLAEALRANLRRRKAQARQSMEPPPEADDKNG